MYKRLNNTSDRLLMLIMRFAGLYAQASQRLFRCALFAVDVGWFVGTAAARRRFNALASTIYMKIRQSSFLFVSPLFNVWKLVDVLVEILNSLEM